MDYNLFAKEHTERETEWTAERYTKVIYKEPKEPIDHSALLKHHVSKNLWRNQINW